MLKEVLKFIKESTNQHGVHSPFVYQLVTQCFYENSTKNTVVDIVNYRKINLKNQTPIEVLDLGYGSKSLNQSKRTISDIAKKAGVSKKYALLLNRVTNYLNVNNALELGTSLGMGTHAIALNNKVKIDSIEGCPETLKIANTNFKRNNIDGQIKTYQGDFKEILYKLLDNQKYDLIYFDGNHQKQPTIDYFEQCLAHKHNDSVFIFDDIYWSEEMKKAWEYIKSHKEVTVTIDIFKWGLVFFRREQQKEHFKIRF